ncbi:MAG: dTDP-glucose 4,6-dehydratase [Alphaproteobacteria bacterium]|nr:dTDP-glucose 4,6-dehydratase [Alphaproteobacteria bacterium]
MKVVVTGGAGFIGTSVVRHLLGAGDSVVNLDKLTYAGSNPPLGALATPANYALEVADVADRTAVSRIFAKHRPDAVMHLAAETHVDRSIDQPDDFIHSNLLGTFGMIEAARAYWDGLSGEARARFRFHHISTDEVFGSLGSGERAAEDARYRPNSPYAASKAGADHLARAWFQTYGLPVIATNCSNNYGPWQFPEKLIPLIVLNAIEGWNLPVYGEGANVRDWLYVGDHAAALALVLRRGKPGETYNIGGGEERRNIDLVRTICAILDAEMPDAPHRPHARLIELVADRPGHDLRYAIDDRKIRGELGWRPRESLETGLRKTVRWYLDNRAWWEPIRSGIYRGERLGRPASKADAG